MRKSLVLMIVCLALMGVGVSAKAVVSDEFGGSDKGNQGKGQLKITASDDVVVTIDSTTTGTSTEATTTPKVNRNEERKGNQEGVANQPDQPWPPAKVFVIPEGVEVNGVWVKVTSTTTGSTTEYKMKRALPAFWNELRKSFMASSTGDGENGTTTASTTSPVMTKVELEIKDGAPAYVVTLTETAKFFGFIPMKLTREVEISVENEEVTKIKQPWYSFLFKKTNLKKFRLN